jgi:hypothetical protein
MANATTAATAIAAMPANTIMARRDRFVRRFPWLPAACGVCAILDADTVLLRIAVAFTTRR